VDFPAGHEDGTGAIGFRWGMGTVMTGIGF